MGLLKRILCKKLLQMLKQCLLSVSYTIFLCFCCPYFEGFKEIQCHIPELASRLATLQSISKLLPQNWAQKHHRDTKLLDTLNSSYLLLLVPTTVPRLPVCHVVMCLARQLHQRTAQTTYWFAVQRGLKVSDSVTFVMLSWYNLRIYQIIITSQTPLEQVFRLMLEVHSSLRQR